MLGRQYFKMDLEEKIICLHQLYKECKCEEDTDETHHPNNYDCPEYFPVVVRYFIARYLISEEYE